MNIKYLIVFIGDSTCQPQVYPHDDYDMAKALHESIRQHWTEVYLCKVLDGPDAAREVGK